MSTVNEEVVRLSNTDFYLHIGLNRHLFHEVSILHGVDESVRLVLASDPNKQIAIKRARLELERILRLTHLVWLPE